MDLVVFSLRLCFCVSSVLAWLDIRATVRRRGFFDAVLVLTENVERELGPCFLLIE